MRYRYFFGIALVVFGILLILANLGLILHKDIWSVFIPCFLVGLGVNIVIRNTKLRSSGFMLIIIGLIFLADDLEIGIIKNTSPWQLLIPALIVYIGLRILLNYNYKTKIEGLTKRDKFNISCMFSTREYKFSTSSLKGGNAFNLFSALVINLKDTQMASGICAINVTNFFGGIKIIVPGGYNVESRVWQFMGACENQAHRGENAKTMIVTGSTVFGGMIITYDE